MKAAAVARAAVLTALVAAATSSFSVYIPATRGFFNVGEILVYVSGLVGGPLVGFVAGGLGSALADSILGYFVYAPGTFVIKGVEGAVVGLYALLVRRIEKRGPAAAVALAAVIAAAIFAVGSSLYTGRADVTLLWSSVTVEIGWWIWALVALVFLAAIAAAAFSGGVRTAVALTLVLLGGAEMVAGYYAYEVLVLGLTPANAAVEIPFNIMQMLVGAAVGVPIYFSVSKVMGWEEQR